MLDAAGLQADPRFKALPPERQQALLSRVGGGTHAASDGIMAGTAPAPWAQPQQPGLADKVGQVYREDVAKPLTNFATRAVAGQMHPLQSFEHPTQALKEREQQLHTPAEKLPPFAREVAEYLVPQTATSAAITAGSLALPAAGAARVLGEGAGPLTRMLGSRIGRSAAETALGAAGGAASGEGAGKGALQGAISSIPGEALAGAVGIVGRHLGEGSVIRQTTQKFGKAISDALPWAGKIEKGSDFADAFMGGDKSRAVLSTGNMLQGVKNTLAQRAKGWSFHVPDPSQPGFPRKLTSFQDADKLISDLQKGYGYTPAGAERAGPTPQEARHLAYKIRDELANGLNQIRSGLGDSYLKARRKFDAAKTLTDMFDKRGLVGPQGLHQPKLIDRIQEYSSDLERSLGQGTSKRLLDVLRRGFIGEGKDIEGQAGKGHWSFGLFGPHYRRIGGKSFDPIGQVPGYIRPSAAALESGISNAIGKARNPERGAGAKHLDRYRAEHVAPTASASDRAAKVSSDLGKGKIPEVHRDLTKGRLSLDETNKLVTHAGKTDAMAMLDDVPLTEAMDSVEMANPQERAMLLPLLKQKLAKELPQTKNMTLASNLSKRFQKLQQMETA